MKSRVKYFSNKTFYTLSAVLILIIVGGFVFAYNSGKSPSVLGHSAEELSGVCKTDGTGCPAGLGGGGNLNCNIKTISSTAASITLTCDPGYKAVSGGYDYTAQNAYGPSVSKPDMTDSTKWIVSAGGSGVNLIAYAVCCKNEGGSGGTFQCVDHTVVSTDIGKSSDTVCGLSSKVCVGMFHGSTSSTAEECSHTIVNYDVSATSTIRCCSVA